MTERHDAIVIGAGFFGIAIALELSRMGWSRVMLVDREPGIMRRASYVNQARVHNGYHYPRCLTTAERSRANFEAFVRDYEDAVLDGTESVYAIARDSRVSSVQFEAFCRAIGIPCRPAPRRVRDLFDPTLIEDVFITRELAFDASRLAQRLMTELIDAGVTLRLGTEARVLQGDADGTDVALDGVTHRADHVFNCTYADIEFAGVALRSPVKKELTELVLIAPPPELRGMAVTVMDGPFFSTMPFPAAGLHSLSHVRHTPHAAYDGPERRSMTPHRSNSAAMVRDSQRYLPCLGRARIMGSLFDVKATLVRHEGDDGRPILIERSRDAPRVLSVLGAKIDTVYDVRRFLRAEDWGRAA